MPAMRPIHLASPGTKKFIIKQPNVKTSRMIADHLMIRAIRLKKFFFTKSFCTKDFTRFVNFQLDSFPSTKEKKSRLRISFIIFSTFSSSLLPVQAISIALIEPALVPARLKKRTPIFSRT